MIGDQQTRGIQLTADQLLGSFVFFLGGMIGQMVQSRIPPHQIADLLTQRAAQLLAGIQQPEARAAMAEQLAKQLILATETNAIAMRTMQGGIIHPQGVALPAPRKA